MSIMKQLRKVWKIRNKGATTLSRMTFSIMTLSRMTFGRMTFSRMTFSRMTFSRMTFSTMTLSRMTLSRITFSIMTLSIMTFNIRDKLWHKTYMTLGINITQHDITLALCWVSLFMCCYGVIMLSIVAPKNSGLTTKIQIIYKFGCLLQQILSQINFNSHIFPLYLTKAKLITVLNIHIKLYLHWHFFA